VAALARHLDVELAGLGVDEARTGRDRAERDARMHVRADDVCDLLRREHAGRLDVAGTRGVRLLARLQQRHERVRQIEVSGRAHDGRERGEVHVVAARVHRAVRGGPLEAGLFDDGERVELAAQADARAGARAEAAVAAGLGDGRDRDAHRGGDALRRGCLPAAQLGGLVELAAQLKRARQLGLESIQPLRGEVTQGVRHARASLSSTP